MGKYIPLEMNAETEPYSGRCISVNRTERLKELEESELIVRKEYAQVPPKVEYFLSPKGLTIMPVLESLCAWGKEHIANDERYIHDFH